MDQKRLEIDMAQAINAFNANQMDIALDICTGILRYRPADPSPHQLLAVIYLHLGHADLAQRHISLSVQARPRHVPSLLTAGQVARAKNDLVAALDYWQQALSLAPNEFSPAYLTGLLLLEQGQHEAAMGAFRRLVESHPQNAAAWFHLGSALKGAGMREEATHALRKAIGLDATLVDACFMLGLLEQELRNFANAEQHFRRVLTLQPDFAEALVHLGIVLQESGNLAEALKSYGRGYKLKPATFGLIANALTSSAAGLLWLDSEQLRAQLSA